MHFHSYTSCIHEKGCEKVTTSQGTIIILICDDWENKNGVWITNWMRRFCVDKNNLK